MVRLSMVCRVFLLLSFVGVLCNFSCIADSGIADSGIADSNQTPPAQKEKVLPDTYTQWEQDTDERARKEDEKFQELWKKTLFLLATLVLFLFLAAWSMKRFSRLRLGSSTKEARIQVTDRKLLSNKSCLYIVSIDNHEFVISESPNGVQLLSHLTIKTIKDS